MQTFISNELMGTPDGQEANRILRSCVHCGFCTATCPTYRLLGDELDSPRGRIYLIKGLLEGKKSTQKTQLHLDRCLTCRACETYCPSGVEYGHLLDIGRQQLRSTVKRQPVERLQRYLLRLVLPHRNRFRFLLRLGQAVRPLLTGRLKSMVPSRLKILKIKPEEHKRKMILFTGCVQPELAPQTNAAASRVLNKLGINAFEVKNETCCGALDFHMGEKESAEKYIKKNIDLWWPCVEEGVEAIVTTASGCGVMIKDYGYILRNDPDYAEKAAQLSSLTKDISEIFTTEEIESLKALQERKDIKTVFQNPCTLQHGQKLGNTTETLLQKLGFDLGQVTDSHLCCGSAGTYSLLQKELSGQLQQEKIKNLLVGKPEVILTSNIGCQMHLQQATDVPVKHWIELVDEVWNKKWFSGKTREPLK